MESAPQGTEESQAMSIVPVTDIDKIGIVQDVPDYELPLNAWTYGRNVRFRDGKVEKFRGHNVALDPPSVAPFWLLHTYTAAGDSVWLYAGLTKVFVASGGVHTDITRSVGGDYAATPTGLWNGGIVGGVPVINNGADVPQFWQTPISVGNRLADLTNWPAANRCKVMRSHKEFLIAMNMTESGSSFIHRVRISHPADPGFVPSSWNDTDPTKDAIVKDLTDTESGPVIDGLTLGNVFVVYKERATHGFQPQLGSLFKWRTWPIFESSGILGDHCVCAFDQGARHFVATGEDIIVHNIQTQESILDKRDRRWLNANMSAANFDRSFVVPNLSEQEVWLCVPLEGATWPNLAVVWNRQSNGISFRDLDAASFIALGRIPVDTSSDVWDSDSQPWDSDMTTWDQFTHPPFVRRMLQAKPDGVKFFHLDTTEEFAGETFESYIERTGISTYGRDRFGNLLQDTSQWKIVRSIYPRGAVGPLEVQLATQEEIEGPLTWSTAQVFTPGQSRPCVDFALPCRLFGVRFRSFADTTWTLKGYDIDVEPLGRF